MFWYNFLKLQIRVKILQGVIIMLTNMDDALHCHIVFFIKYHHINQTNTLASK